jgi:hypothetical protein
MDKTTTSQPQPKRRSPLKIVMVGASFCRIVDERRAPPSPPATEGGQRSEANAA